MLVVYVGGLSPSSVRSLTADGRRRGDRGFGTGLCVYCQSSSPISQGTLCEYSTKEPPRPPTPEPTIAVYDREQGGQIKIRLVGSHPLWGHYLYVRSNTTVDLTNSISCSRWNASRAFASYLEANPSLTQNKCVLELGAGGGLPSIIAIHNEARKVRLLCLSLASGYH